MHRNQSLIFISDPIELSSVSSFSRSAAPPVVTRPAPAPAPQPKRDAAAAFIDRRYGGIADQLRGDLPAFAPQDVGARAIQQNYRARRLVRLK